MLVVMAGICRQRSLVKFYRNHHVFTFRVCFSTSDRQTAEVGRWVEAIDPATGFTFWYNEHTMEHRDTRPVEYNYQSFQDKPVDADVKLVRGLDGRMWET